MKDPTKLEGGDIPGFWDGFHPWRKAPKELQSFWRGAYLSGVFMGMLIGVSCGIYLAL